MSKTSIIIQREYITRVRKKTFIIMTLLAPILMAALFLVPAWLMTREDEDHKKIAVIEENGVLFKEALKNTKFLTFQYVENTPLEEMKQTFSEAGYYGVLYISPKVAYIPNAVQLITMKQPAMDVLNYISNSLEKEVEKLKLESYDIENLEEILKSINTSINVQTIKISESGEEKATSTGLAMGLAYASGLLMYMLTFIFGAQVMRGVIEEKTNRVVEVIISSVKPFQLMMGKIIGIALVGLTQFLLWIILTGGILLIAKGALMPDLELSNMNQVVNESVMSSSPVTSDVMQQADLEKMAENPEILFLINNIMNLPWGRILISFIFYFLTGYLLYASLFAAIGSAVDNETDTQQFMLPITIPLILALFVAMSIMENPESSIAFWFSIIPFTAPVVMMARLAFDVPWWEQILSMTLMVIFFVGGVWIAAKIYRTGILMYGKKASWKELFKWIRFKG